MVWYFIGVYIINRTLHGRLEIQNFSSKFLLLFIICVFAALTREIFFNTRREISYLRAAMWYPLCIAHSFLFWCHELWKLGGSNCCSFEMKRATEMETWTSRELHGRAEIRNFSSSVEKYFTSECSKLVKYLFQHEKRISYLQATE